MALGQPLTIPYYYRYCKQWKCETNKLVKQYKSVISFEQNYQVKAVLNSKTPELYKKPFRKRKKKITIQQNAVKYLQAWNIN